MHAPLVREQIDILIDLSGHTTGLQAMDYRITDSITNPPGDADGYYTERLLRLTNAFFCNQPPAEAPEAQAPPLLRNGYVTFGSFNCLMNINAAVIALWSKVLNAIPDARFLLQARAFARPGCHQRMLEQFARYGIDGARLEILGPMPLESHLGIYHEVDIVLDNFPWGGHTMTCHALWIGVPVIALAGDRSAGRMGASILNRIGLDRLVARTPQEYTDIARRLIDEPEQLRALRATLRTDVRQSVLCDGPIFYRDMESLYRNAWQRRCWELLSTR